MHGEVGLAGRHAAHGSGLPGVLQKLIIIAALPFSCLENTTPLLVDAVGIALAQKPNTCVLVLRRCTESSNWDARNSLKVLDPETLG